MSKKQSSKEASLEDYSEYDDPLFRREIRAEYRSLIGATQREYILFRPKRVILAANKIPWMLLGIPVQDFRLVQ